ncbi:zinc finger protein [Oryctes borbonicus]|uniref:Zinc finger protein n=1 Tax=Oryctes borbonicus TaxID=1629725 RepID=A0A0T6BF20_9SCAR|nr:zinc finger protein [Oryctes borbonicus]
MGTPGDKSRISKVVDDGSSQLSTDRGEEQLPETLPPLPFQEPPSTASSSSDMTVLSRLTEYPLLDINVPSLETATKGESLLEQAHIEDYFGQSKYYQPSVLDIHTKTTATTSYSTEKDYQEAGPSGLQTPKTKPVSNISKINPKRVKKAQTTAPQTGKKSFSCQYCQKTFQNPANLAKHQQMHVGSSPYKCEHCKKSFTSKFKLVRHVLIHSDKKPFSCTVCERTFHRKDHLNNHVKVHSPSKKVHICEKPDCKKEYTSSLSYKKHLALHEAEEGNLECQICLRKFDTKSEIMYHLKIHAGSRSVKSPDEKKFTCDHCDRKFFTRKDVRRHLVVHTGMRDFLCQFCPQRFGRKDHLVRHIKKSHSKSYTESQQQGESSTSSAAVKQEPEIVKFELAETLPDPESTDDDNILDTLYKSDLPLLTQSSVQQVLADLDSGGLGEMPESSTQHTLIGSEAVSESGDLPASLLEEDVLINESEIIEFADPRQNFPLPAFSKTFQPPPQQ